MTKEQKDLINLLYDNIKSVDRVYESDSNGPDYVNCPMCGAFEQVIFDRFSIVNLATMGTLNHDDTFPYVLISKIKLTMNKRTTLLEDIQSIDKSNFGER